MPAWLEHLSLGAGIIVLVLVLVAALVALVVFAGGAMGDAYRAHVERSAEERAQADAEERVLLKAISLRERHDVLLDALETLVRMHRGLPNAVGNWEWAIDRAESAIALAKAPLVEPPPARTEDTP
jgi:hypothetical protein